MIQDYDGLDVVDAEGERIGTVERSYVDDRGAVQFVEVKIKGLRARHRLVPADEAERTDGALRVPFGKDVVETSPDASAADDTLEGDMLGEVRAYYENLRKPSVYADTQEVASVPVNEPEASSSSPGSGHEEGIVDRIKGAVEQVRRGT